MDPSLHLEVVEVAGGELVVELLHVLPWAIPDPNQDDGQRIGAEMKPSFRSFHSSETWRRVLMS